MLGARTLSWGEPTTRALTIARGLCATGRAIVFAACFYRGSSNASLSPFPFRYFP